MADRRFQDHSTSRPLPADSGLRCPVCEYNLTGLTEDRCPECGEAFDRAELEENNRVRSLLPPGLKGTIWGMEPWNAYMSLVGRSLFHPVRLAKTLPRTFFRDDPLDLGMISRSYATLMLVGFQLVFLIIGRTTGEGFGATLLPMIVLNIYVWVMTPLAELVMVVLLNAIAMQRPAGVRRMPDTSSSWFGLVSLHSVFLFVMSAAICLQIPFFLIATSMGKAASFLNAMMLIPGVSALILLLWWWINLSVGVYVWSKSKVRAIAAIVVIPIVLVMTVLMLGFLCSI